MTHSARVTSIDALPLLAAALQKFRSEGANAVDDVANEVRRALEWVRHDQKDYWTTELRRAEDALSQARVQLQQAMAVRRLADRAPSCDDDKRLVERAKRRVEIARRKLDAVRHWSIALEQAADDFRRSHMQFASWIDLDVSRAAAVLNKMSESLVTYVSMKSPEEEEMLAAEAEKSADAAAENQNQTDLEVRPTQGEASP